MWLLCKLGLVKCSLLSLQVELKQVTKIRFLWEFLALTSGVYIMWYWACNFRSILGALISMRRPSARIWSGIRTRICIPLTLTQVTVRKKLQNYCSQSLQMTSAGQFCGKRCFLSIRLNHVVFWTMDHPPGYRSVATGSGDSGSERKEGCERWLTVRRAAQWLRTTMNLERAEGENWRQSYCKRLFSSIK